MSVKWDAKDPDNVANYRLEWADELNGDTIATSTFSLAVAAGLVIDSQDKTTDTSIVVLSGGTAGMVATLNCRIVTAQGHQLDQEVTLEVDSGLVVEDGTGKPDADSYASVATADAYCAKRGIPFVGAKADKEHALRTGFDWLNLRRCKGARAHGRAQGGVFPRVGCTDANGEAIGPDEVPVEWIHANIELAAYERANPGGLNPSVVMTDRVQSEQIDTLRVVYAAAPTNADAARPVLTRVDDLIAGLLASGGGNMLSGRAARS